MKNEANSEPERLTIHLQGCGSIHAKRVSDVLVGDVLVWNYGHRSEVVSIVDTSACFVTLGLRGADGSISPRKLKRSRLVGWTPKGTERLAGQRAAAAAVYAEAYAAHIERPFGEPVAADYLRLAGLARAAGMDRTAEALERIGDPERFASL